jgi:aldehyde dehydrogenase (NAD+)
MSEILDELGIKELNYGATSGKSDSWLKTDSKELVSISPINGIPIAKVIQATDNDYESVMKKAGSTFKLEQRIVFGLNN